MHGRALRRRDDRRQPLRRTQAAGDRIAVVSFGHPRRPSHRLLGVAARRRRRARLARGRPQGGTALHDAIVLSVGSARDRVAGRSRAPPAHRRPGGDEQRHPADGDRRSPQGEASPSTRSGSRARASTQARSSGSRARPAAGTRPRPARSHSPPIYAKIAPRAPAHVAALVRHRGASGRAHRARRRGREGRGGRAGRRGVAVGVQAAASWSALQRRPAPDGAARRRRDLRRRRLPPEGADRHGPAPPNRPAPRRAAAQALARARCRTASRRRRSSCRRPSASSATSRSGTGCTRRSSERTFL